MKLDCTDNITTNKKANKVADMNMNPLPVLRNTRSTRNKDNALKAKTANIQEDVILENLKTEIETSNNTAQSNDIEINFSSKKNKFSRTSLPANTKQPLTSKVTSVTTRKSDSSLQVKRSTRKTNITYGFETIKSLVKSDDLTTTSRKNEEQKLKSILKKKPNITYNLEPVKKIGNNTKVSPKRQSALPINLEKMFKKKPNISFTLENLKSPTENLDKTRVLDKKSISNFKPRRLDKRKTNIIYKTLNFSIEPTSVNNNNSEILVGKNSPNPISKETISDNSKSRVSFSVELPESHINNDEIQEVLYELDPKTGVLVQIPQTMPTFSTSKSSTTNLESVQSFSKKRGIQNTKSPITSIQSQNNICDNRKQLLTKGKKVSSVYSTLFDTYRYIITPKTWSVMEMTSETNEPCIVFYNTIVMKEKDVFISVMKKSLIIDETGKMHYSVHGLSVDLKTTILPKVLDSTKKLLSILHIFDKMQICMGIGNDLDIIQDEAIFKDTCRLWRHIDCKIILMKATRCSICSETRDVLLETET